MLLVEIAIQYLNIVLVYDPCRVPRGRCSKMLCRVSHLFNFLQSANVFVSQSAHRYKYYIETIHDKSFCYIQHIVQVIWIEN